MKNNDFPDLLYVGVKAFSDSELTTDNNNTLQISEKTDRYTGWMFTRVMKSEIIRNNQILFDEDVHFGEDDVFCVFFQQHSKTELKLDEVIYFYRQRPGSALHSEITATNIEKFLKTYSKRIEYAEKYDFFWYKKDMVYKAMPGIMVFIAKQPYQESKKYIKRLKEYNLFPLKKQSKSDDQSTTKVSGAKKIRERSYQSYFGYIILRLYLKLKSR